MFTLKPVQGVADSAETWSPGSGSGRESVEDRRVVCAVRAFEHSRHNIELKIAKLLNSQATPVSSISFLNPQEKTFDLKTALEDSTSAAGHREVNT